MKLSLVVLAVVDEYRTTDAAREEYWRIHPPAGWRRLVPRGMLVPPEPVDDLAALILARAMICRLFTTRHCVPVLPSAIFWILLRSSWRIMYGLL